MSPPGAKETARKLAQRILEETDRDFFLGPELAELVAILRDLAAAQIDPAEQITSGETRVAQGLAISPTQATMCADDPKRTIAFMRGVHATIAESRRRQGNGPVRILYAGCGPYAVLVVPALLVAPPASLEVVLLDLHPEALDSAGATLDQLGVASFVTRTVAANACDYTIPADETPAIILSETMNAALENEPQVSIARHLLHQAPEALLIPECVTVCAVLLDPAKEFSMVPSDHSGPIPDPERDRISLGTVFELSHDTIHAWHPDEQELLPGGRVTLPIPLERRYEPMLMTTIRVFGDEILRDYDSGLTNPRRMPITAPVTVGGTLECSYRLGSRPALQCALKDPGPGTSDAPLPTG